MKVNKVTKIITPAEVEFEGATLLSADEAETLLTPEERVYSRNWWLRTPGYNSYYACYVSYIGNVVINGLNVIFNDYGIRPVLKITNLGDLKIGDMFEIDKWKFKIISPKLAWLYKQDIRTDSFDEKTNDYEKSHAKKVVDSWYETLLKEETI